jgi:hypothetical protein
MCVWLLSVFSTKIVFCCRSAAAAKSGSPKRRGRASTVESESRHGLGLDDMEDDGDDQDDYTNARGGADAFGGLQTERLGLGLGGHPGNLRMGAGMRKPFSRPRSAPFINLAPEILEGCESE